jgi:hypothetical protein
MTWACRSRIFDVEAKVAGAVFGIGNGTVDVYFASSMKTAGELALPG